jgi:hypothetical protein
MTECLSKSLVSGSNPENRRSASVSGSLDSIDRRLVPPFRPATKMRLAHMPSETHQLVAQDSDLEDGVQIVGGVGEQPDYPAQQQIGDREEHRTNLPGDEARADPTNALAVAPSAVRAPSGNLDAPF